MDDARVAAVLRALRVHRGMRQVDVARVAQVSQPLISRLEHAQIARARLEDLRAVAAVLELRLDLVPAWRGGDLDRLVNARHSALHEILATRLGRFPDWESAAEVSYAIYGERGVIDRLAFHRPTQALAVFELKSELTDPAGLIAQVDRYRRVAPTVARQRGLDVPAKPVIGCWAVVAATDINRRRVAAHAALLRGAFPAERTELGSWLLAPSESINGLVFVAYPWVGNGTPRLTASRRVRRRGRVRNGR